MARICPQNKWVPKYPFPWNDFSSGRLETNQMGFERKIVFSVEMKNSGQTA